jgi:membrane-associated HD superfamily phosphohydrolase
MGYWLHFMLPALGFALVGAILPVMGIAAIWLVVAGNLKRVRDLRVSQGRAAALLGLWGGAMVIASVVAGGLLLFGLLALMSNGGPDGEALMMYSVLVFLAPIVVALLVIGFVPGGLDGEAPAVAGAAEVAP